jgi:hypothetical protein
MIRFVIVVLLIVLALAAPIAPAHHQLIFSELRWTEEKMME